MLAYFTGPVPTPTSPCRIECSAQTSALPAHSRSKESPALSPALAAKNAAFRYIPRTRRVRRYRFGFKTEAVYTGGMDATLMDFIKLCVLYCLMQVKQLKWVSPHKSQDITALILMIWVAAFPNPGGNNVKIVHVDKSKAKRVLAEVTVHASVEEVSTATFCYLLILLPTPPYRMVSAHCRAKLLELMSMPRSQEHCPFHSRKACVVLHGCQALQQT